MQQLASSTASVLHPQHGSQQAGAWSLGSGASPEDRRHWRKGHSLLSSQDEAAVSQAVTQATKQQETALQVWLSTIWLLHAGLVHAYLRPSHPGIHPFSCLMLVPACGFWCCSRCLIDTVCGKHTCCSMSLKVSLLCAPVAISQEPVLIKCHGSTTFTMWCDL